MLNLKEDYLKQKTYLKGWLLGKGYFKALKAMEFAQLHHNGKRKDGQEEFSHQVSQACYAITLSDYLLYPEDTFCVIFSHDLLEDKGITVSTITDMFGERVGNSTRLMSKVLPNQPKIPNDIYYHHMSEDAIASVCKGFDRLHNLMSMLNAFKPEKQVEYLEESLEKVVPMLKKARKLFPEQHNIYQNIKYVMINQIQLYKALNNIHE